MSRCVEQGLEEGEPGFAAGLQVCARAAQVLSPWVINQHQCFSGCIALAMSSCAKPNAVQKSVFSSTRASQKTTGLGPTRSIRPSRQLKRQLDKQRTRKMRKASLVSAPYLRKLGGHPSVDETSHPKKRRVD